MHRHTDTNGGGKNDGVGFDADRKEVTKPESKMSKRCTTKCSFQSAKKQNNTIISKFCI